MPTIQDGQVPAWDSALDQYVPKYVGELPPGPGSSTYLVAASNLSDLASASSARTNLGLGSAALLASSAFVSATATQTANTVLAGPASGGAAAPSFRSLVAADIPSLTAAKISDFSAAADARITAQKGVASGLATLGADSKIPTSQLPALAITDTFVVSSQAAMLALSTAETGDVAVRTDPPARSFILAGTNPAVLSHWQELLTPTDAVLSVNGMTGAVTLTTSHITEGSNLYYSQARFDTAFAAKSTTNLAEGSNLYFTNARARSALSGTANQVNYDNTTGVFSLPQSIHTAASPTFATLALGSNGLAVGTSQLVVSGGNVGIGTATPASVGLLTLNKATVYALAFQLSGATKAYLGVAHNANDWTVGSASGDLVVRHEGGNIGFSTDASGLTSGLYLKSGGGVGVGTTSPAVGYRLDVAGAVQAQGNVFVNTATANLYLKDTSTGWQAANSLVLTPQANNAIRSTAYTSGLLGWNISAAGDVDINNLRARGEIVSSVFKVNEISATAGTFGVFYSAAALSADATTATVGNAFTFTAKNSDAGGMLFGVGDVVRIKTWTGAGVSDSWATVTARTNNGATTTYTATLNSGSASATFRAGSGVVDYGPAGTGNITLSTDGTVGASPNLTMAVHNGSPWSSQTTLLRLGNLNGSYGYASAVHGFGAGQYGAAGQSWVTVEQTNGVRLGSNTTARIQLAPDGSGFLANSLIAWDTSGNLTVTGNASIAGWTVNSTSITSGGITLAASATAASNKIYVGTGTYNNSNTAFYVDGSGQFSLKDKLVWDGSALTIVGGGTFSGALSAATGTFAGSLSAATGTFTGDLSAVGGTFAGALSGATGTFAGALSAATGTFAGSLTAASGNITGVLQISSAGGAIAVGTVPPTSASAGTGFWWDRTGIYGLASSVVQAKWEAATGKLTAGAGDTILDATGITLLSGVLVKTTAALTWKNGTAAGDTLCQISNRRTSAAETLSRLDSISPDASGYGELFLTAQNSLGAAASIRLLSTGTAYSVSNVQTILMDAEGVTIGPSPSTPAAVLDVRGTGSFTGNVSIGSAALNANLNIKGGVGSDYIRFSSSVVAHGITTIIPTDVCGQVAMADSAKGGMFFRGITDAGDATALTYDGIMGATSTTVSAILFRGFKKDGGTSIAALASTETLIQFQNFTTPILSLTAGGRLHLTGDTFRLETARTPASAGAAGNTGDICWDSSFVYVCVAASTWKRAALSTW